MMTSTDTAAGTRSARAQQGRRAKTTTMHLPGVTVEFAQPRHIPGANYARGAVSAVQERLPPRETIQEYLPSRQHLPTPQQAAYYGGLGTLAAFAVIEWPVAIAIGAGTLIAQRSTSSA